MIRPCLRVSGQQRGGGPITCIFAERIVSLLPNIADGAATVLLWATLRWAAQWVICMVAVMAAILIASVGCE